MSLNIWSKQIHHSVCLRIILYVKNTIVLYTSDPIKIKFKLNRKFINKINWINLKQIKQINIFIVWLHPLTSSNRNPWVWNLDWFGHHDIFWKATYIYNMGYIKKSIKVIWIIFIIPIYISGISNLCDFFRKTIVYQYLYLSYRLHHHVKECLLIFDIYTTNCIY